VQRKHVEVRADESFAAGLVTVFCGYHLDFGISCAGGGARNRIGSQRNVCPFL